MMMPNLKKKVAPNPVTEESFFLEDTVLTNDWMGMPEGSTLEEEATVDGQLAVDVYETAKEIVVKAPVAGVDGEDIDITVTDEMVIIRGERKDVKEVDNGSYHSQECYWGSFSRSVSLPQKGLADEAKASFAKGILTIRIPKAETNKLRKIKVNAG
ncbi:MAG: Hsp20 family protein [Patescibacteria group bacterium]|nr:Hsp20 family protein [Patescibacteria group bacterium]